MKFFITLIQIIPLFIIIGVFLREGIFHILKVFGFGIGCAFFILLFTIFLFNRKVTRIFIALCYLILGFVFFSHVVYLDFIESPENFYFPAPLVESNISLTIILFSTYILFYGLFYYALIVKRETRYNGNIFTNQQFDKQHRRYVWLTISNIITYNGFGIHYTLFLDWWYRKRGLPVDVNTFFEANFPFTTGFLFFHILSWGIIFFLSRKIDSFLGVYINECKIEKFNVKRQVLIGIIIFFIVCTFFESFRGLWWVWFWTAILLILIFASLWNVWKHVLDVPKEARVELNGQSLEG